MNIELEDYARTYLKQNLKKCSDREFDKFKRMYSHKNLNATIDQAIDNMNISNLDWAMQQVSTTLTKRGTELWTFRTTSTN
jgi:hypothetical protein